MNGWLKFHRAMLDHPVWRLPPGQTRVWLTILALANVRPADWFDGQERVPIAAGGLVTSHRNLAKAAGVTRRVVRRALVNLERIGSIRTKVRAQRWSLVEVVNFAAYQGQGSEGGPAGAQPNRAGGPSRGPSDSRGENGEGGPSRGPSENPQAGHSGRRKSGREIGARSSRRGGGGADGATPRPPVARPDAGSSQGPAAREEQEHRPLRDAAGPEKAEEALTLRQLETIALVSMPPGPLSAPARASRGVRVPQGQDAPFSGDGASGTPPMIREDGGTGPP